MTSQAAARQPAPEDPDGRRDGGRSFLDHLEELRKRIARCAIAVGVGMLFAFFFIDRIVAFIMAPARSVLPPGSRLIYTAPGEAFSLYINVALIAGAVVASPVILYHVWRLIAPALYSRERRFGVPFVALTSTGCLAGAAFNHYVLFPSMIRFFGIFNSADLAFLPRVSDAFGLYLKMLLGMIVAFQMPTVVFFLAKMGLVTAGWLWRNIRYAVFIIFIAAAVITPSADPWNQTVFAAPMIVLYLLSIGIAWLVSPTPVEQGH